MSTPKCALCGQPVTECECKEMFNDLSRELSPTDPEPESDLIGNDPLSWALQELMGLGDKFGRQIYTVSRLFAAIRTKRDRSGGVCVCDRADQPKPERAEPIHTGGGQLANIPMKDGITKEWLEIWSEVETWYGDIKKHENGAQFLKRMQVKYPIVPQPTTPGEEKEGDEWYCPKCGEAGSTHSTICRRSPEEKEPPADILEWIDAEAGRIANEPIIHEFQAARAGMIRMWRKMQAERPGSSNPEASYWFEKARTHSEDRNDFKAQLSRANERIASLTKELDKADGIKLFHETKSSLKDAEISELSKQIASLTAERDEWKMAIAEAVCGQVQLDIGWQRMLDKYPQTKQA